VGESIWRLGDEWMGRKIIQDNVVAPCSAKMGSSDDLSKDSSQESSPDSSARRLPGRALAQPEMTRIERELFHGAIKQRRQQIQEGRRRQDSEIEGLRAELRGQPDKDKEYSDRFWERNQKIPGIKDSMIESLKNAIARGDPQFQVFVTNTGLTQEDKEKLSTYRAIAREIGVNLGPFRLNKKSGTAAADVVRI
jgi:hypothetical protein